LSGQTEREKGVTDESAGDDTMNGWLPNVPRAAVTQDCTSQGGCMENPDPIGGGGDGGSGCQYCYATNYAPYGNCYSAAEGYGTGTPLAQCEGIRYCWTDGSGQQCVPACQGYPCYFV
jgi:hypothetical protein